MHEVWEHAQLKARDRWTEVDSPAGRIAALVPPALPSNVTPRMDPVPALGQHTDAILRELGYDRAAIERLRTERAI
jgi:itaconate CoA-transferase